MIFRRSARTRSADAVRRILYVEACEDGTVGGSHQALYDLVRMLDRRRYEPVVLFYQTNRWVEPIRALGVEVILFDEERRREKAPHLARDLPGRVRSVIAAPFLRAALLRRLSIDLVHLNNSPAEGYEDWLPACRLVGVPCVA
ncbi:MAG TPA: glycosyltransferase, partial [Gemmatimonadaceae bacterium]|nr:glycosyltransferase [Gemmatimonadaceae bacterium]